MIFHVGQKVVCVDLSGGGSFYSNPLVRGEVYTISVLGECHNGQPGLLVAEVEQWPGYMFKRSRFRPAVEKPTETGMAILRSLLTPTRTREHAR